MKYFTPELLDRYGYDDPAIYHAAEFEWEERCHQYNAAICGMGHQDQFFLTVVQLGTPPYPLLTFTYDLRQR